MSHSNKDIGFIGLGVMGEPICRNLSIKSVVTALDLVPAPLQRLAEHGVRSASTVSEVVESSRVIFLALPSGEVVSEVAHSPDGLLASVVADQMVVDLGTSPVDMTRRLAGEFAERGAVYIDAPVARTRAAAESGTLSVMVGADPETFGQVQSLLSTFASDITHCGAVGCGQVVKILNNMVLFETVTALSEAKAIGERAGVDAALLFDALSKGSADSFALRNHGMKAILPDDFPLRAFSVSYARKDLGYALRLAQETEVDAQGARNVDSWFAKALELGVGEQYFPVVSRLIGS
jgi:3-hydroxyisobutyrate dehydrogenase-like beta-hydroxyacid dehydrogenase